MTDDKYSFDGDKSFAVTLARGLQILRCFTSQDAILGNGELAKRTGFSKPTVSRFSYTLLRLGYLRVHPVSGKYQLGAAVLSLVHPLLVSMGLRQLARPRMNELAEKIQGSVSMGIRDRLSIVYVETSRSQSLSGSPGEPLADIGLTQPIITTAIGRAWLANCGAQERAAVINEISIKTPQAWARQSKQLTRALEKFKELGYCSLRHDPFAERFAVGIPLGRLTDGERIVFNCTLPSVLVPDEASEREIASQLKAMVERIRASTIVV